MKRKLIGLFVCMLMVATIPLAAGAMEDDNTETKDGFFGYTIVRGWAFNPKWAGNTLEFRALRIHYTEFTGMETATGVLRGVKCSVRAPDLNPLIIGRQRDFGPLGSISWLFCIFKGSIDEC